MSSPENRNGKLKVHCDKLGISISGWLEKQIDEFFKVGKGHPDPKSAIRGGGTHLL